MGSIVQGQRVKVISSTQDITLRSPFGIVKHMFTESVILEMDKPVIYNDTDGSHRDLYYLVENQANVESVE